MMFIGRLSIRLFVYPVRAYVVARVSVLCLVCFLVVLVLLFVLRVGFFFLWALRFVLLGLLWFLFVVLGLFSRLFFLCFFWVLVVLKLLVVLVLILIGYSGFFWRMFVFFSGWRVKCEAFGVEMFFCRIPFFSFESNLSGAY